MSKKITSRIAAAVLATGLVATGLIAGSSGPANAAWDGYRYYRTPITDPVDPGADDGTVVVDGGGFTTQRHDTGWG